MLKRHHILLKTRCKKKYYWLRLSGEKSNVCVMSCSRVTTDSVYNWRKSSHPSSFRHSVTLLFLSLSLFYVLLSPVMVYVFELHRYKALYWKERKWEYQHGLWGSRENVAMENKGSVLAWCQNLNEQTSDSRAARSQPDPLIWEFVSRKNMLKDTTQSPDKTWNLVNH